MSASLRPLFRPSRIAVIGASANPEKMGFQIFRNIREAGFPGEVIPVNPKGEQILGAGSVRSVMDLPEGVDLAVVIIPAKAVPSTVRELGERGVRAAIIISGGFAESGEDGAALQAELARTAAQYGLRVVGPNCQGVNYPYHSLCASWPLITRRGELAIVSQSGTVGAALIDWASEDGLGFSAFVSMGNRADVDESDLIDFFADDPNTKVVALYIEGVKDTAKFLSAVRKCRKPIVVLKAGRTERGRQAAESHTRSLAGRDAIYDGVFRQFRIHRASTLEELYDFAKALAYVRAPTGPRMLIVTSSGGSAIIGTDVAEEEGFSVAPLPPALADGLRELLPSHCIVGNPLDLTGDADAERYRAVLTAAEAHYDVLMAIIGDPIPGASTVVRPTRSELVTYLGGADVERVERRLLHEKKIAVFPTPERAVRALACHTRFDRSTFPRQPEPHDASHGPERGQALTPAESMALLARHRFPVVAFRAAGTAEEAVAAAREIGFPVAVKINSVHVTHKSDVGGVILNLADEAGVRKGFDTIREILARIGAEAGGVVVSTMAPPGQEVVVGLTKDLQFGHAVMFGLGGILVEVLKDVAFRIVPVTRKDAAEMIAEIRGARVLQGVRGGRPVDGAALQELLVQVSDLAMTRPEIAEMDLNPVIVYEKGLFIVDARIVPVNGASVSRLGERTDRRGRREQGER
jgi:acyl-CoA synthetase (NDP forming)